MLAGLFLLFLGTFIASVIADKKCGDPAAGPVLGGVDLVEFRSSYERTGKLSLPVRGSKQFTAKLDEYQFWFQSSANAELFAANPSAYSPQYGGYCAWGLTGYDTHVTDPSGYSFGGACVNSTNGFEFVTVDAQLENVWYLMYEAKHDMNLAGAGDLLSNMKLSDANYATIVQDHLAQTGSKYCFNTNNVRRCD